jgi:hypothetical protein
MFNNWYRTRKAPGPSASFYERQLSKLNLRIEKITLKGRDNYLDFSRLIDEMVEKGQWSLFEQCVYYYYGISLQNIQSIESVKKSTWTEICFQTNTSFLVKLKKLYDDNDVYQTGFDIYSNKKDFLQLDLSNPVSETYFPTNYSSSFDIPRIGDIIYMDLIDKNVYYVMIERADWILSDGFEIPINKSFLQDFFIGTQSGQKNPNELIKLEIPTDVTREYTIYTQERQNLLRDFIDNSATGSFISSSLGVGSASWASMSQARNYIIDVSTFSSFQSVIPGYGTVSLGNDSSFTYINGLSASTLYYWKVKTQFSYIETFTSSVSGLGTASWTVDPTVSSYIVDVSTYSSLQSFLPDFQNIILGTTTEEPSYIISGSGSTFTASFGFSGLSASTKFYVRIQKLVGKFANLNYKLVLFGDPYLGKIIEREVFTEDSRYLVRNKRFASLVGARKTYLEVHKKNILMPSGYATASIFAFDDLVFTEDSNLLTRYTQAINYLNS